MTTDTTTQAATNAVSGHPNPSFTAQAVPATTVKAASHLKQWMFDPNHQHHALLPKRSFEGPASRNTNLKNSNTKKFLQWEHMFFGINLGFTSDASATTAERVRRWFFTRPHNDESPLRYGDVFALGYGADPSYIRNAQRSVGVDLKWSTKPKFEWEILGGPRGTPVRSGDWVAIYNRVAKEPLIHFPRELGGEIGWPSSTTLVDQLTDVVLKFIRDHWKEGMTYLLAM
ncbi:hypothetical protein KV102_00320 [Mumia sp. zg.B53]|uniref:hypothetical protein n=1 Tax=Mumia sp. zg.B53 TaxID=2855449 RepID=UPI001C6F2124|nr:hypothetical protein [Mumia sp. zg.B53]MBW9213270.1 hypothetical protein [Mumia sp. zg.B53]